MKTPGASREVLPIWKTSGEVAVSDEIKSIKSVAFEDPVKELTSQAVMQEFERSRNLGVAAELMNIALLEKDEAALRVSAEYIINHRSSTPDLVKISRAVLKMEVPEQAVNVEDGIASLRNKLNLNPNNPLLWANLSRAYVVIHEPKKAERAMLGALHYASNHRWVSRVASRFYVHMGDPGKALRVLQQNPNLKIDPWLLSAELAICRLAERPLKNWNQAKKLVESSINPLHLSELASSIGTSEIIAGSDKKARAYFKQALVSPNSNSLAQVKWADRSFKLGFAKQIHSSLADVSSAYEARHWECYEQKNMIKAIRYARMWWNEEPYSKRPPQAICFIASLINDLSLIYETAQVALDRNPDDTTMRLNDIYARACLYGVCSGHKLEVSVRDVVYLKSIMAGSDKDYAAHAYANAGLINYRLGFLEQGKELYAAARSVYDKNRSDASVLLLLNHYRETLIAEARWSDEVRSELISELGRSKTIMSPAGEFYLEKIGEFDVGVESWSTSFARPFDIDPMDGVIEDFHVAKKIVSVGEKFWLPSEILDRHNLQALLKLDDAESVKRK